MTSEISRARDDVLERAFRDARASLINPPLEDITLQALGDALSQ